MCQQTPTPEKMAAETFKSGTKPLDKVKEKDAKKVDDEDGISSAPATAVGAGADSKHSPDGAAVPIEETRFWTKWAPASPDDVAPTFQFKGPRVTIAVDSKEWSAKPGLTLWDVAHVSPQIVGTPRFRVRLAYLLLNGTALESGPRKQRLVFCFQGTASSEEVFFCRTIATCDVSEMLKSQLPPEVILRGVAKFSKGVKI
jgi:hypothetical protein